MAKIASFLASILKQPQISKTGKQKSISIAHLTKSISGCMIFDSYFKNSEECISGKSWISDKAGELGFRRCIGLTKQYFVTSDVCFEQYCTDNIYNICFNHSLPRQQSRLCVCLSVSYSALSRVNRCIAYGPKIWHEG